MAARIVVVASDNSRAHAYDDIAKVREAGFDGPQSSWLPVVFFNERGGRLKPVFRGPDLVRFRRWPMPGRSLRWRLNKVLEEAAVRTGRRPTALPINDLPALLGHFYHSGEAGIDDADDSRGWWHNLVRHGWRND